MSHALIWGFDAELAKWACQRIPWLPYSPTMRAVGVAEGPEASDSLLAVCIFHGYIAPQTIDGKTWYGICEISFAAASPRWATRRTINNLLSIPFLQYGCRKVVTVIPSTNKRAIRFNEGVGLKPEGTLRHHFAKGVHACVHGMMSRNGKHGGNTRARSDHRRIAVLMGKSTPSPPPASDPSKVAQAQSASNVETAVAQAYLNNVNQKTPYGDLNYDVTGRTYSAGREVPIFTASQNLSPAGQKLLETNMATTQGTADLAKAYTGRIADATSGPYNYNGLPGAPQYNEAYRQQQLQAIQQRAQPQMDRDQSRLEQRLADQGVGLQDPAYRSAMDQYQRGVNDFRLGADVQAGNAASQQYGLEANTRDRAIQEMANLRSQPINEVAALMGTGSGVQNPQFVNTPQTQVAPTDVTGAYANSAAQQQAAYQAQLQSGNAAMGGLFGLGGSILGGIAGGPVGASVGGWLGRQFK